MRTPIWLAVGVLVGLFLAACGGDPEEPRDEGDRGLRIVVVTHGSRSDPFWAVVANGVDQAQSDLGISVEYHAPDTFDVSVMAGLIDQVAGTRPDGLVISIPDAEALGPSIRAAIAAGVPVVSINSGSDVYADLGVLAHVGQTEYEAGFGAGARMAAAGVSRAICVNHEAGNVGLDLRCEGFADGLGAVPSEVVPIDLGDPTAAQATIEEALSADASVDGVLALGPGGAERALAAREASGRAGEVHVGTFDLSEEVLTALDAGQLLFAIDQQQYLQGYLGVLIVTQFAQYGLLAGGGAPILTGPHFLTQADAAQVIELRAEGIR